MSNDFPSLKGRQLPRLIEQLGFETVRIRGSHRTMTNGERVLTFAFHDGQSLSGGVVRKVLTRDAGLTDEEARRLLS